jgi:DnaJ domain/PASTA domain
LAELITWYDILGVTAGAAADTINYAYAQRTAQLRPDLVAGAPSPVVAAATRAREAVQAAWLVLSDPDRRNRYDKEIGQHRKRGRGFAHGPHQHEQDPYDALRAANGLIDGDIWHGFSALASWMAPLPTPPRRRLIIPDVRGLFYRSCQAVVTMAGLRLEFVRLTPDPSPVEGLVVGQSPAPGTRARYQSTLTVQVWHPPRGRRSGP